MIIFLSLLVQAHPELSYGQNPYVSIGGTAYDSETKTLLTPPSGQDLIITDIVLTSYSNLPCKRGHKTELATSSNSILGQFETSSGSSNGSNGSSPATVVSHSFAGGMRIPNGESLVLSVVQSDANGSNCSGATSYGVRYMISGKYVQP